MSRFSQYRIMWIFVFFDLPTETPEERKAHAGFRKSLLKDGFTMMQYSVYMRHCSSDENAKVHEERVKKWLPEKGHVAMMKVTDRQFGMMQLFYGSQKAKPPKATAQLTLF